MINIAPEIMRTLREATGIETVREMLTNAVELELATIPTYYTGAFSIKPGANDEAKALILSVAYEEMLHMSLAANLLIAVGGNPPIRAMGEALRFPTPLPMSVDEGVIVALGSTAKKQVYDVFMGIEHPDTDAVLPGEKRRHPQAKLYKQPGYNSIGDFYNAILEKLAGMPDAFAAPRLDRQLDIGNLFPGAVAGNPSGKVKNMKTARQSVDTILAQGEGAQVGSDPIDPTGGLGDSFAHYFKFAEIYYGKRLVKDKKDKSGWSYSGEPVPLNADGVYNFKANPALSDYEPGTAVYAAAQEFYLTYMRLLDALDGTFNGNPSMMSSALGIMFELKLVAAKVLQHSIENGAYQAAPPFQLEPNTSS